MSDFIDWSKYGKRDTDNRRIAIPVSLEMEKLIQMFKDSYGDRKFSDTKVIGTFVEAGARLWIAQRKSAQAQENTHSQE